MREINSGDQCIRIRASNMARFYFYQEFGADIGQDLDKISVGIESRNAVEKLESLSANQLEDLKLLQNINDIPQTEALVLLEKTGLDQDQDLLRSLLLIGATGGNIHIPIVPLMKIVWAMNKAQNEAERIQTPAFDQWLALYDDFDFEESFNEIFVEIRRGFFREENNGEG